MALELEGKIIQKYPEASGVSQKGNAWRKQLFVVETQEQYPKKVAFNVWNDNVDALKNISPGDVVKINFRAESREFNDKWYTDLTVWKIVKVVEEVVTSQGGKTTQAEPQKVDNDTIYEDDEDNPFKDDNTTDISKDSEEEEGDLPF